jgi:hypothetical protein
MLYLKNLISGPLANTFLTGDVSERRLANSIILNLSVHTI